MSGASWHHWLGTDQIGRDTLTRAIWGDRTSMTVAIGAPLIGLAIGLPIGIVAGWFGGIFDWLTLRLFELFQMVPTILAALLFITVFGVDVWKLDPLHRRSPSGSASAAWPGRSTLPSGTGTSCRRREPWGVPSLAHHHRPHPAQCVGPIIVFFVQQIPYVIFTAAGFSFLGLGIQDPRPTGAR